MSQKVEQQVNQMLGEQLYPLIERTQPELAGKITGMILELDDAEILPLLDSEEQLEDKIAECLRVLDEYKKDLKCESSEECVICMESIGKKKCQYH